MKSDRLLEEIKDRTDIVDFISGYVQLRKSGQNWKGLCPFHSEKTPSFMVSPSKQIYHCFGCGAGGDVISFLVNYERMTFQEAVNELAQKAGVQVPAVRQDRKAVERGEQIRNALREAAEFYSNRLRESAPAREYIKRRGINGESLSLFRLGYAPAGWSNLLKHLKQAGYGEEIIKEAGLAVPGSKGLYDMFRERIIFPITAANGTVIAFGGRAMDDSLPKYINSPETPVFRKSETLYGLSAGKDAIRQAEKVIIVEGYMDVIICFQHGFRNVVAPLGTSLTAGHLQKLRKLASDAVMVFDGDAAGIAAAKRALPLLQQNDFNASVLILPDKEDPDSFLRKHGSEAFGRLLESARSVIDFMLGSVQGRRTQAVRDALALIAERHDRLEAEQMLMELAGKTRISEATLRDEYRRLTSGKAVVRERPSAAKTASSGRAEEELLLSAVIAFPDRAAGVLSRVSPDEMDSPVVSSLFRKIMALPAGADAAGVLGQATEEERLLFTRLSVSPGFDPEFVDRNIEDCFMKIGKRKLEERLHRARAADDLHMINALLLEKKKSIKGKGHERI